MRTWEGDKVRYEDLGGGGTTSDMRTWGGGQGLGEDNPDVNLTCEGRPPKSLTVIFYLVRVRVCVGRAWVRACVCVCVCVHVCVHVCV